MIRARPVEGVRLLPSRHYLLWLEEDALNGAERRVVAFLRERYAAAEPASE